MAYFKVKSITNKLAKRDVFYNAILDIDVIAKFDHNSYKLGAGREMVINADNLPLSVHKLRAKKLVEVIKISDDVFLKQVADKNNAKGAEAIKAQVVSPEPFSEAPDVDEDDDDETKKNKKKIKKY